MVRATNHTTGKVP